MLLFILFHPHQPSGFELHLMRWLRPTVTPPSSHYSMHTRWEETLVQNNTTSADRHCWSSGTKSLQTLQKELPKTNQSRSSLSRLPPSTGGQHSSPFITIKRLIYVKCERNANRTSASGLICGCQGAVATSPLSSETYFGEMIQQMVPVFCFAKTPLHHH